MALSKIWVHAEVSEGEVKTITLEMLAKAREIADTVEVFIGTDGDGFLDGVADVARGFAHVVDRLLRLLEQGLAPVEQLLAEVRASLFPEPVPEQ